jgi:D-alanyl-D-alanine carboxypeptidase
MEGETLEIMGGRMRIIAALALIAILGCQSAPVHADHSVQPQLQTVLDEYVSARGSIEHITGAALYVDVRGTTYDAYAGTNGRTKPQPIDRNTLFQIGSNTKHFTAALILKLEAQGALTIEQTVGDWLPQYPDWAHVTIRQLLNMTSPIANYSEVPAFARTLAADIHHQFSYDDLVASVYEQGLPVPTGWFYSNTNNVIAAKIIEAASGKTYREELEELLLKPLHLKNTFYEDGPYPRRVLKREPVGIYANTDCTLYQPKPCSQTAWGNLVGSDVSYMNLSWAGPAGGMVSNPRDLTSWVRDLFSGRVIPAKQLQEMTTIVSTKTAQTIPDVTPDDPSGFGLDLGRYYQPDLGRFWSYQGMTLGSRALFAYWPEYDVVITCMTNSQPEDAENQLPQTVAKLFQVLQENGLLSKHE